MPHLSSALHLAPGPTVSPIVGNANQGGACYDRNGQALYAVNVGGSFQVWRTRAGWSTLIEQDGSVDYLSTIVDGGFYDAPSSAALQRINGVIYANVAGKNPTTHKAGHWLYRDTSAAANGSGPWVLHGTITEYAYLASQTLNFAGGAAGGEILVNGSQWLVNTAWFGYFDNSNTQAFFGVAVSNDSGATWNQAVQVSDIYVGAWARNFAYFGGSWYTGGQSHQFKSADLTTWTEFLKSDLYRGGYPISYPGVIYSGYSGNLSHSTSAPEADSWTYDFAVPGYYLTNIHASAAPVYTATGSGKVMRVSVSATKAPPCRLYPREDGLGTSSATRQFPRPRGQQSGYRQTDYY